MKSFREIGPLSFLEFRARTDTGSDIGGRIFRSSRILFPRVVCRVYSVVDTMAFGSVGESAAAPQRHTVNRFIVSTFVQ